ncbi:MAG: leucine-rich repeat domain-containing protein [Candidatus Poribacteria bacterium]|nr:leucine-rich repeat domain-containing protein [Candidatus Poribacteria bacterium]
MPIKHLFFILTVICTLLLPSSIRAQQDEPQVVNIPDPNLAARIRSTLGVSTITTHNLLKLTTLSAPGIEIEDLTGLEYAQNLRFLSLANNNISDISPLTELKNLRVLSLGGNNISDITPLAELKELDFLWLNGNNISDISPLAAPTQIRWLDLGNNNISDVSPLVKLASVIPYRNGLRIYLRRNNISDISPFLALDPRAAGRLWLLLSENPLNDLSRNRHIPALEAKGVRFGFSPYIQAYANSEITGPWLWMIAPTDRERGGAQSIDVDSLAAASKGTVTEADVAIHRANAGDRLGNFVWTPGRISALQNNNINDCLNRIGMIEGNVNDHSAYALFSWVSDTDRTRGRMYVGYDDAIKIWLNGEVVYRTAVNRHLYNFGRSFQVNLKRGQNLLLVKVNQREADWSMFVGIDGFEDMRVPDIAADVNRDGIVNVQDLVLVSSQLGQTGRTEADVNGDGAVNIQDLALVAGALGDAAAAPSAFRATATALPARATVEQWLADAYRLPRLDARLERGVAWLERLLAALVPAETALLTNYPNPFNPETWIPYELAEPAEVMLRIYAVDGTLVRRLVLGHRAAGIYRSKSRAAYWDGRNAQGEKVASGLYFYTFSAGDFEATRKMLIRK